jgi:hypothetical protein
MSTSIGAYPATLPEAWAEIRALRTDLIQAAVRLQTRQAWAAEPMVDVHHRDYLRRQNRAASPEPGQPAAKPAAAADGATDESTAESSTCSAPRT